MGESSRGIVRPMPMALREHRPSDSAALQRLTRVWGVWLVAGLAGLGLGAAALSPQLGPRVALWLGVNLVALGGVMALVRSLLPSNRRSSNETLLPDLGPGNQLTILRGVLIAHLPGYLLFPWIAGWQAWLPAMVSGAAQVGDFLDGYFARRSDRATRLGERLDIEFDGLGLMAATGLAVHYGQLPAAYFLTVGIARYVYLAAGWATRRSGRTPRALTPSTARRGLAGVVMELGVAALWPIAPPSMITLAGILAGAPLLAGFARDIAVQVGWLDPGWPLYRRARDAVVWGVTILLPPFLRLGLAIVLGPLLAARWMASGGLFPPVPILAEILFLLMILLGLAGRAGAAGLLVVLGLDLATSGLSAEGVGAWGLAFAIYLAGTGPASIWSPELALVRQKAGS